MTFGLRARLLGITTAVLALGLGFAGWVLDRSFNASVDASAEAQLRLVTFSLLGAAEEEGDSLRLRTGRLEPRLTRPGSGLYARVWDEAGSLVWASPSLRLGPEGEHPAAYAAVDAAALRPLAAGRLAFRESEDEFAAFYPVIWEATGDRRFIFESRIAAAPFRAQTASFRTSLMVGLGAVVVLLMAVQAAAIAIGLEPVQRMARRVREVEAGERTAMGDDYPPELRGLAANIDRFIGHESASRDRYRKAMEDLAHSLKTPLAVLRNALHGRDPLLEEQVDRMEVTVTHQLSRARAARPPLLVRPVLLRPLCERLVRALERAYADKAIHSDIRIDADASVRCDERDLMEMMGNLLENAFKFGRTRVRVSTGPGAAVLVEDDGPGVPEALRDEVLARGARADTAMAGQGIGLAVVVDLAVSYGGRVSIRDSALGGAAVLLELP